MRFLVPPGLNVLELGSGAGDLLAALAPARGVGLDLSPGMVEVARQNFPDLDFLVGDLEDPEALAEIGGTFDVIILSETVGDLEDVEAACAGLHRLCRPDTRLIVSYHASLWKPVLRLAVAIGQKMPAEPDNWLSIADIENLLALADFEIIKHERRQLLPKRMLGLGPLINRFVATLPVIRHACLYNYIVVRPLRGFARKEPSASIIIPARNERGNIEPAITRTPKFCKDMEFVFIEGHSSDGTLDEIRRVKAAYPECGIEVAVQDGIGKGDAPGGVSTELQAAPWLVAVADAQALPFAEAARVLRPGGRVVLVEPAITPVSWPVYNFLHEEPVGLAPPLLRLEDALAPLLGPVMAFRMLVVVERRD